MPDHRARIPRARSVPTWCAWSWSHLDPGGYLVFEISYSVGASMNERRHDPVFPGFKEAAERRRALAGALADERLALGLSQTEVAARMGTSQSAVARLESGDADIRLSTLERYAAALGHRLDVRLEGPKH